MLNLTADNMVLFCNGRLTVTLIKKERKVMEFTKDEVFTKGNLSSASSMQRISECSSSKHGMMRNQSSLE